MLNIEHIIMRSKLCRFLNLTVQLIILSGIALFPSMAFSFTGYGEHDQKHRLAIVVSRHIKPYMEALGGLRKGLETLSGVEYRIFIMDDQDMENPAGLSREVRGHEFDILVSIGPEATSLAWTVSAETGVSVVHSMVLDPEALASDRFIPDCGISLSIPVLNQLMDIKQAFPDIKRIGVLFNPELNRLFFIQAREQADLLGLEAIPLQVSSSREIPAVLAAGWESIDALWLIPDRTVISQALVEYMIKEALFQNKPVVGYNRFFHDSGAALAFALDFDQIGKQTAALVMNRLKHPLCGQSVPAYEVLINHRVVRSLGLRVQEDIP